MSRSRPMPTARDRAPLPRRRLLSLTLLITAVAALLAFAGTAAAETKVGEYSAPLDPTIPAEASVLHASTEYDAATGAVTFAVTTGAEPRPEIGGEENEIEMFAILLTLPECSLAAFKSAENSNGGFPLYEILSSYSESTFAEAAFGESEKESPKLAFASKEVEGTKTSLKAQNSRAVNQPFTCGAVFLLGVENEAEEEVEEVGIFPLSVKPEPPATETKTATPAPETKPAPPAPAPAPAALSIAKAKKPLNLKVGKWATVKVKVTNTGATATGPGALRVKASAGVLVKPERQKVPILAPGGSWTISVRVQLTARAKARTTLALTGTAPGLSAKGSLVLKRAGD
jgi:hypothetical protein